MTQDLSSLEHDGFAVVTNVLSCKQVDDLLSAVEAYCETLASRTGRPVHAIRNLFDTIPQVVEMARCGTVRNLIESTLGKPAFAVRAIYFDKPPGANWKVPWHQDQAIAVKARIDVPGFGPWSVKDGVRHVEPPVSVLERMLTVRVHLDDCGIDNGPLRVIPGSHSMGRLMPDDADRIKQSHGEIACTIDAGGVLLMRPLLLHASSPAKSPSHRRIIHIEFAATDLPNGLEWASPIRFK